MGEASLWSDALTRAELDELLEQRDIRSWLSVAVNWGLVFAAFALVGLWPNPLSVIVALFVIGARQLGLAVLMHEASHRTLFRGRRLNEWAGNWLCAYPVWLNLEAYRAYHLTHHANTGTPDDPDLGLVTPFPITRASLRRKIWRDLSGRTGWKFAKAAFGRSFGRYGSDTSARRAVHGVLVTNLVLLSLLTALGRSELYLLWVGAWLTTNTLVTRIRSIAEHALTPDAPEPLGRTRTTLARWWERLLISPNRVGFHLEHHLQMTVPHYSLARMHRLLTERGVLEGACVEHSYLAVLARAASLKDGESQHRSAETPPRIPPF